MNGETGWYERRVTETALRQGAGRRAAVAVTTTRCPTCGDVLETTADMSRWKWDGRSWRHGCQRGRG